MNSFTFMYCHVSQQIPRLCLSCTIPVQQWKIAPARRCLEVKLYRTTALHPRGTVLTWHRLRYAAPTVIPVSLNRASTHSFQPLIDACHRWTAGHTFRHPDPMSLQRPLANSCHKNEITTCTEASLLHYFRRYSDLHQKPGQANSVTSLLCEVDEG